MTRDPENAKQRDAILEDLPEIRQISNKVLQEKVVDAWLFALTNSSFYRISDIPGDANPDVMRLKNGRQDVHLRGVAALSLSTVDYFAKAFPEAVIDRDIVLAGALCHDIGKAWECDPENQHRWQEDPTRAGKPSLRHPIYGAYVCLTAGLPEEIAHIAACHSPEGDNVKRSLECVLVHEADVTWWTLAAASGLIEEETIPARYFNIFDIRPSRPVGDS